jgi:hypothetical protein
LPGLPDLSIPHAHPPSSPVAADVEPSFDVISDPQTHTTEEEALEEAEADVLMLGKAYFDAKEFERSAAALRGSRSAKGTFLRLYSRYLAGEKQNQEQGEVMMGEFALIPQSGFLCKSEAWWCRLGPKDKIRSTSKELLLILQELRDATDPFQLYLSVCHNFIWG